MQPKKAASKAASPIKKAVPKSSVGTKRIGKRSGSGGGGQHSLLRYHHAYLYIHGPHSGHRIASSSY